MEKIDIVGTRFAAQAQSAWDIGLMSPVQYICREQIKNQALINQTTTTMELDDNQVQIRGTDMNELTVRGCNFSYKSTRQSTSTILIAIIFFLYFSDLLPLRSLLSFILHLSLHLYPTHGQLMAYANPCPINLLQKSLGMVVRLKKYCSKITSSLMRPESQLQSI